MYDYMKALQKHFDRQEHSELGKQVEMFSFCAAIVKETFAKTHRCKPAKKSSLN